MATIVGVYFTIDYSNFKRNEEEIKSIKPILFTEYCPAYNYSQYATYDSITTFVLLDSDECISTTKMKTPAIIRKVANREEALETERDPELFKKNAEKNILFMKEYYLILYEVSNIGAGNAIGIDMTINGKKVMQKYPICFDKKVVFKMIVDMKSVVVGEEKDLHLVFQYTDIYEKAQYSQEEHIRVFRDEDNRLSSRQQDDDMLSEQQVIIN